MLIEHVRIGGWFQRTRLHLGEVYDFLRAADSPLDLNKRKLTSLRRKLDIKDFILTVDELEYIVITTNNGIAIRMYEDGLVLLETKAGKKLADDVAKLTSYYEKNLSPAFGYIFSLGAPVPKELANIKTVYPYFVTAKSVKEADAAKLINEFGQSTYFEVHNKKFDIYRGDKLYVINKKSVSEESARRFVEEQIFLREFRGQMHRYLNLHRIIWEKIASVKERGELKGSEIPGFKAKVDQYKKTIDFIGTRINQMGTYLDTRESISLKDKRLVAFQDVLGYKHETLKDTLSYIKDIWDLTQKYVDSAVKLFSDLQASSTSSSIENLTVVTSMGVGATLIGLFATDSAPEFTIFGIVYFFALAAIGYSVNKFMKWYYRRRTYEVSDIEIDKNI